MFNFYAVLGDTFVIIGIILFFVLVIFLQVKRKKKGKGKCSSCTTGVCCECNIKEAIKASKKDRL